MEYADAFEIVKNLKFDKKTTFFTDSEGLEIFLLRPSKLPASLKNKYDPNKNFQIWLKNGEREFRPNHLRILIDLNLRVRSRPDLKRELLKAFDDIFHHKDPDEAIKELKSEEFEHFLNSISISAHLAQLFIIEQDYNYIRESNFDPPVLFLQGWIRQFLDSPKEIDNLCMSVCRFQPPAVKYTCKDNRKHKNFDESAEPLWYLD